MGELASYTNEFVQTITHSRLANSVCVLGAFHRAGEIGVDVLSHLVPLLEFTQLNQNNRNTLFGLLESGLGKEIMLFPSLLCYAPMPVSLTYYSHPKKPIMLNQNAHYALK